MKRNRDLFQYESYLYSAYNCLLPLSLPLLGPFRFPFFILFAVFFPLQPFMLIFLIAVISRKHNLVIKSSTCICECKIRNTISGMLYYPRQLEKGQEEMASNSTRGSSGWTPGRISSLEGWLGIGMGCPGKWWSHLEVVENLEVFKERADVLRFR